jgi:hypothetical protein
MNRRIQRIRWKNFTILKLYRCNLLDFLFYVKWVGDKNCVFLSAAPLAATNLVTHGTSAGTSAQFT